MILAVDFRVTAPLRVVQQWADGLKANAERINEKRKARIPNEEKFQARVAKISNLFYAPTMNPSFISRAGLKAGDIVIKQGANLRRSFRKYNERLDYVFATVDGVPAKRFKELVDLAQTDFSEGTAARLLPFTGVKVEELGPAPITVLWLTADPTTEDFMRSGDKILEGGPFLMTMLEKRSAFKAALAGRLIQAGAAIVRSNFDPMVIAQQNALTNSIVQGFVDPALGLESFTTGGASKVDYIMQNNDLYLEIKVSQV